MPSVKLLQGAQSLNPTQEAYEKRKTQIKSERSAEAKASLDAQTREDNDFHKVVKYASDGYVDEARHYAKSKGLKVPEQIYTNSNLAKGLSLAGDFHGDDKQKGMKFAQAYSLTPGTMQDRLTAAHAAAGTPVSPDDREFQKKKRWAEYEAKHPKPTSKYGNYKTVGGVLYRIEADGTATAVTTPKTDVPTQGKFIEDFLADAQRGSMMPIDTEETIAQGIEAYKSIYGGTAQPVQPQRPSGLVTPPVQPQPAAPVQPQPQPQMRPQPQMQMQRQPQLNVPPSAADALRRQPELAKQFDLKYGAGASAYILGR